MPLHTHTSQSVVPKGDNIPNYPNFLRLFANKNKTRSIAGIIYNALHHCSHIGHNIF